MNQPYPRLPEFNYLRPESKKQAVNFLTKYPDQSRPYAGGTDCFVQIRDRRVRPHYLIDLKSIDELQRVEWDPKTGLTIGSTVDLNTIIACKEVQSQFPVLAQAAEEVGGYQLRNRATLAGNLCNASPCGDTIGPCLNYAAKMHIFGPDGERTAALKDFIKGPGKTCLQPGEIVTAVSLPVPEKDAAGSYQSIGRNKLGDLAIAAVTVLGWPDKKAKSGYTFKITLTAVAPTVIFAEAAQEFLRSESLTHQALVKAADACADTAKPITDIRGSAEYRTEMIRTLALKALTDACVKLGISY